MKLRPIFDRMMIEPKEVDRTKGGIVLPDAVNLCPITAVVLSKGEGAIVGGHIVPNPCEVGDTILFDKAAMETIEIDGVKFHSIRFAQIMAIIEP